MDRDESMMATQIQMPNLDRVVFDVCVMHVFVRHVNMPN